MLSKSSRDKLPEMVLASYVLIVLPPGRSTGSADMERSGSVLLPLKPANPNAVWER